MDAPCCAEEILARPLRLGLGDGNSNRCSAFERYVPRGRVHNSPQEPVLKPSCDFLRRDGLFGHGLVKTVQAVGLGTSYEHTPGLWGVGTHMATSTEAEQLNVPLRTASSLGVGEACTQSGSVVEPLRSDSRGRREDEEAEESSDVSKSRRESQRGGLGCSSGSKGKRKCPTSTSYGSDDEGDVKDSKGSKRSRLTWTPELHARFLNAVNHLGVKNAVPKTILQLMNVEGMTRENVASHLQKYRLYLKRLAGLPANAPLSVETLQQVQQVQQAMQQQVEAGLIHKHSTLMALNMATAAAAAAGFAGASPLASPPGPAINPLTAVQLAAYQDLVSQMAANTHVAAAALAASQQPNPLLSLAPSLLPVGMNPVTLGGFGGINPALLLNPPAPGLSSALGVNPLSLLHNSATLTQQLLAHQLLGAMSAPSLP